MPFSSLGLHADLLRGVVQLGFKQPTTIQKDTIPPAILGRDVVASSSTGSGKTAAFGLPILNRLMGKNRGLTRALILTPTRELAAQIDDHLSALCVHTKIKIATVYGGVSMGPQKRAFQTGVDIIVATPGRLLDHFQSSYARLDGLEVLVLDEADRMLDMGFLPDIRKILKQLPAKRQTLFFSATMPGPIITLTKEMLHNPVTVNIERKAAPAEGVAQTVFPVPHHLKSQLLLKIVNGDNVKNALVFTRTKHRADRLAQYLAKQGVPCGTIHGNRSQSQRTHALDSFKHGRFRVLVATDVAARGIDVEALSHVVNFDVPGQPEDYIHRVGRTARAALTGDAFTFVASNEEGGLRAIERAISKKLPRVTFPDFDYTQAPKHEDRGMNDRERGGDRGGRYSGNRNRSERGSSGSGNYRERDGNRRDTSSAPSDSSAPRESAGRPTRPWEKKAGSARPWEKSWVKNRRPATESVRSR